MNIITIALHNIIMHGITQGNAIAQPVQICIIIAITFLGENNLLLTHSQRGTAVFILQNSIHSGNNWDQ